MLRPYGVWAVISPFNFPLALAAGPAGGALVAGNTVVFKPASDTPYIGPAPRRDHERGRHSARRVQLRHGRRRHGGPGTDRQPRRGRRRLHRVARRRLPARADDAIAPIPRPLVIETGGKNPAIIMPSADLDKATDGVYRSAFGEPGPEVLGVLAHLRAPRRAQGVRRDARREDEEDQDRQPARPGRLHGAGHQRGRRQDLRAGHRAGQARRRPHPGWRQAA